MRKRKQRIKAEINVVPFLDVLLVLLLIFMLTAPIISQSVVVDLPDSSKSETVKSEQKPPVILEVSTAGIYSLNVNGERSENLDGATVVKISLAEFSKDNEQVFLVGGDKKVAYEEIIKALSLLREAGIKKVGLMTNPVD